jgi:hypothetical protein
VIEALAPLLIQDLAGRGQRLQQHRARFRRQPAAHDHHTVFVLIHPEGTTVVTPGGLARLGDSVHPAPATDDPLGVPSRASAAHCEQTLFGLGRGHAGERPHLGVRELAA